MIAVNRIVLVIASIVFSLTGYSQFHTFASRSELGFLAGGSYYIGDLNRYKHFKGTGPSAGLIYRYNFNTRLALRATFAYGRVEGNDSWSKDPVANNRNLNFRSNIFELATGVEFHYVSFQLGSKRHIATGYLFGGLALFHMNPKGNNDGEWVELRPLQTEGRGTPLNDKKNYSKFQLGIPLGLGFKVALGKRATFNIEYGLRKTFTDYLDDVGSGTYVDPVELAAINGSLAAQMSNRSIDQDRYGVRGNGKTKDWYFMFGAGFTFRLGDPAKCMYK